VSSLALGREALPVDVRLMNGVASVIFALAAVGLAWAAVLALTRLPMFNVAAIRVEGDLSRNSVASIRANATPQLTGNFFSIDLKRARAAFESVPWVRQAVVRRVWPDRLAVQLEEHRPEALWQSEQPGGGSEHTDRLVNSFGEVFQANVGDVEDDSLPTLAGPEGASAEMLSMLRRIRPVLAGLQMELQTLELSRRGSWRVELDSGAFIQLGRGSEDEVVARLERFVRTWPQVTERYQHPLEYADLRHEGAYAVRLRGVSTQVAGKPGAPAKKP
jgi:cell division protein FtsQ